MILCLDFRDFELFNRKQTNADKFNTGGNIQYFSPNIHTSGTDGEYPALELSFYGNNLMFISVFIVHRWQLIGTYTQ